MNNALAYLRHEVSSETSSAAGRVTLRQQVTVRVDDDAAVGLAYCLLLTVWRSHYLHWQLQPDR